jgi:transposase
MATAAGAISTAPGKGGCRRPCGRRTRLASACSSTMPDRRSRSSTAGTGEVRQAQVFVAAMGASSYTYAEATWTQTLPDWIGSHTRALAFFGGVPAQLVPDNPRVGVDRANWYEPGLNRTYLDLATHYGTAILPARVRRPRDKAKVEVAVLVVERWILARLRHRRFFSLAELNEAMALLVTDLNARPMRRLGVSRRDLFLELDHPALKPLPAQAYEYAEWRLRRVSLDYHVDIDGHYYSVPYRLIRDQVEARLTTRTVEIFHKGERVAVHLRGVGRGRHTTVPDHMPSAHRRHAEWTIERIQRTAARIGPSTARLLSIILESRPHPEQGYRACLGILRLARQYSEPRLEAACERGLDIGARSYGSIQSILKNGLDRQPRRPSRQGELVLPDHPNIRGPHYYH